MRARILSRLAVVGGLCLVLMGSQFSCSSGGDDDPGDDDGNDSFDVSLTMKNSQGNVRSSYQLGENLVFELTVTNQSGNTEVLNLPTGQIYDLALLTDNTQTTRWRWSFNRSFPAVATNLTFAGHQSITYLYIWTGVLDDGTQLMPGTYQVRGTLAYPEYAADWRENDPLAAPIKTLTITN